MTGYQCGCFRAKTGLSQTNRLKTCRYSLTRILNDPATRFPAVFRPESHFLNLPRRRNTVPERLPPLRMPENTVKRPLKYLWQADL